MAKPFTMINLDRPRKLRYTTNALVSMEEILEKPIGKIIIEFSKGAFGFKDVRTILWAGLLHEEPGLTQEQAGDILDEAESFSYAANQIAEALRVAFDSGETTGKNTPGPTAKRRSGTGTKHSQ